MHKLTFVAATACCLGLVAVPDAWGHEQMIDPPLRDGTNQKVAPCGGVAWGSHVSTVQPGSSLTMHWIETIHHPGWFRISFRAAETGDFNQHILVAKVESMVGINDYTHTITVPQTLTTQGSVQLAFVMTDQPNSSAAYGYSEYSNCIDLVITNNPNNVGNPNASASPTPSTSGTPDPAPSAQPTDASASPEPSATTTETADPSPMPADAGGCAAFASALAPGWALAAWTAARLARVIQTRRKSRKLGAAPRPRYR